VHSFATHRPSQTRSHVRTVAVIADAGSPGLPAIPSLPRLGVRVRTLYDPHLDAIADDTDVVVLALRDPAAVGVGLTAARRLAPSVGRVIATFPDNIDQVFRWSWLADGIVPASASPSQLLARLALALGGDGAPSLTRDGFDDVTLPGVPHSVPPMLQAMDDVETTGAEMVVELHRDAELSAHALRLVNSPGLLLPRHLDSLDEAVGVLGRDAVQAMTLSAACADSFIDVADDVVSLVQTEGTVLVRLVREIAGAHAGEAQTAAILKNLGRVVLLGGSAELSYKVEEETRRRSVPRWLVEERHFGWSHAEAAAALLAGWGFPTSVIRTISQSCTPFPHPGRGLSAAATLYLANVLLEEARLGRSLDAHLPHAWLDALRIPAVQLEAWRSFAGVLVTANPELG